MTTLTALPSPDVARAEWLHWLFTRDDRTLSCSLEVYGDGTFRAMLVPLWSPDDHITEHFRRPAEAIRWQEGITQQLQAAGWLLIEGGVVTNAA